MHVITRFAPSPTGALHLGGARTAIFCYLWAKHTNGQFLLRIEDTDTERSKEEHTQGILESMRWLGLSWNEPLWYQSKRIPIYKKYVQQLLDTGHAYYCTCSTEEVERMREEARNRGEQPKYNGTCREKNLPYTQGAVVRLKTPYNLDLHIQDTIKGEIIINTKELDEMVLSRADGMPTYNLAVVVDDYEMGVNYIIRGDDHVANTPKQILLYKALDIPIPQFAHVPMILGSDKQKLSKRHGATAVIDYEKQGFLPEAMVNYLVRLGWSHGDEELFIMDKLIECFTVEALNASPSALDFDKLRWVNAHYIKTLPVEYIAKALKPFMDAIIQEHGISHDKGSIRYMSSTTEDSSLALLVDIVSAFRERVHTLCELAEQSMYIMIPYTALEYVNPPKTIESGKQHLRILLERFSSLAIWEDNTLIECLSNYMNEFGLQNKDIFPVLRFALTATKGGPDIPVLLTLLGKEESMLRLQRCLECV